MATVGSVLIRSSQDLWTKQVIQYCQSWLLRTHWDLWVECTSEVTNRAENFLEIILLPGEEQSNGLLQVTYATIPSEVEIENILHGWLFHLAEDPMASFSSENF